MRGIQRIGQAMTSAIGLMLVVDHPGVREEDEDGRREQHEMRGKANGGGTVTRSGLRAARRIGDPEIGTTVTIRMATNSSIEAAAAMPKSKPSKPTL